MAGFVPAGRGHWNGKEEQLAMTHPRRDPHLVDVEKELEYWRSRIPAEAVAREDFMRHAELAIREACEIYLRYPHASVQAWQHELQLRLPGSWDALRRGYALQMAGQCWQRLRGE